MLDSALRFIAISSGALSLLRTLRQKQELERELIAAGETLPPDPFDQLRDVLVQTAPALAMAWMQRQSQERSAAAQRQSDDRRGAARCEARVWRHLALGHREAGAEEQARVCERHAIELEREHNLAGDEDVDREEGDVDRDEDVAEPSHAAPPASA